MANWYSRPAKGHEWSCINRYSGNCHDRITSTKPTTKKCPYCGGSWMERDGWYGVFHWTGTGRYPADEAVELFTREKRKRTSRSTLTMTVS